ncbi:PhoX family protein [Solirubrobacter phytolaccae]|uniref:PhoX family protein n=1 Tax=Solirubrobacter phytolaccae TaxID=1404360 RepID=A0A9X3NIJ0_9ACTN|nr:alkaline phosphatase PhoX [Solirubrobacter phytolaccae]MDA0185752.1 PhoX family protein [Solirubrobacter phytolaccae]
MITRRHLIQSGLAAATAVTFGPSFWRDALAAPPAQPGPGPYGPLLPADANGIMLPSGFSSRVIATANAPVAGTGYVFPWFPDGQATYPTPDGGWILVTNSEIPAVGGVSAIRFDARGTIVDAYRILANTNTNCAGGATPWGTWLSCEEVDKGSVWECDPTGARAAVEHQAMGVFKHEAACVDPLLQQIYLSEDISGGGLYRYTPTAYPDLSEGLLEIACGGPQVVWKPVPDPRFTGATACKDQVADSIKFGRGEGLWYDAGRVYLATTSDETIHVYDTRAGTLEVLYNADNAPGTPLRGVDNLHVSRSGDLFVAEDSYDNDPDAMDICLITPDKQVARFLKLTGDAHFLPGELASETVGITFDPSGTRMYVGSQRYAGFGIVYEIAGPFRLERAQGAPPLNPVGSPAPPAVAGPGGAPGVPIGLDVASRMTFASFIRRGLALGITVDKGASIRVKVTAKVRGRRVTLASGTRLLDRGHTTVRFKPTRARAKPLKARRQALKATVEVKIVTRGAPTRTLKRTVTLRR